MNKIESKIRNRVKKYIFKPHKVMQIILYRIRLAIRYYIYFYTAKSSKGRIHFGHHIAFCQKTLLTGNGSVSIGDRSCFGAKMGGCFYKGSCELQPRYEKSKIMIGKNVATNNNLLIICASEVIIGDNTLIGEGVMIIDHDAHGTYPYDRRTSIGKVGPICIGENVWIGSRAIILPGTKIGNNSIVGAGAVVKGEFADNVIIVGNPAKVIRQI